MTIPQDPFFPEGHFPSGTDELQDLRDRVLRLEQIVAALAEHVGRLGSAGPAPSPGYPDQQYPAQPYAAATSSLGPPQVIDAIRAGSQILAIKAYREATGAGLKEAKDAVDEIARKL